MPTQPLKTRIKNIQRYLAVRQSGEIDINTCNAILDLTRTTVSSRYLNDYIKAVQKQVGLRGSDVDGIAGVVTVTRIEAYLSPTLPPIPVGATIIASLASLDFILKSEIISEQEYSRRFVHPIWPGAESGITIGIGYDLGYNSQATIQADWQSQISNPSTLDRLKSLSGLKGTAARDKLSSVRNISIAFDKGQHVFYQVSLPKYARLTKSIYPGIELLPPDAQGALLSLVYNRGTSLAGPRRAEMRNIVNHVVNKDLNAIAFEIRSMKRLWEGQGLAGLIRRREQEAILVEQATYFLRPEEYILV